MSVDTVWLLGYPVDLGIAGAEHVAGWVREFRLMGFAAEGGSPPDVTERLAAASRALATTYGAELSGPERVRDAAAARGQATVDLAYPVRPETEQTVVQWQALLEEVDAYCAAEGLLSLARSPELVALSQWVLEEFQRQLHGEAPRPWRPRLTSVP